MTCWLRSQMGSIQVPASIVACLCFLVLCAATARAETGFTGLGDLPGGFANSQATAGISADGRVIAGESVSASGTEAFRWTVLVSNDHAR